MCIPFIIFVTYLKNLIPFTKNKLKIVTGGPKHHTLNIITHDLLTLILVKNSCQVHNIIQFYQLRITSELICVGIYYSEIRILLPIVYRMNKVNVNDLLGPMTSDASPSLGATAPIGPVTAPTGPSHAGFSDRAMSRRPSVCGKNIPVLVALFSTL